MYNFRICAHILMAIILCPLFPTYEQKNDKKGEARESEPNESETKETEK